MTRRNLSLYLRCVRLPFMPALFLRDRFKQHGIFAKPNVQDAPTQSESDLTTSDEDLEVCLRKMEILHNIKFLALEFLKHNRALRFTELQRYTRIKLSGD